MTMPRLYCPDLAPGMGLRCLGREHRHYLSTVLRCAPGQELLLFDGCGNEYRATLRQIGAEDVAVEITARCERPPEAEGAVVLLQSLPKADMMDFIVQKATELGVTAVVPFLSLRSIPHLTPANARRKLERWQKIAVEAARQSGRSLVPTIGELVPLAEALRGADGAALKIMLWEEERETYLADILSGPAACTANDITLVIGPEGGFAAAEAEAARAAGFTTASLGSQVLKVDTAVLTVLVIVQYTRGFFSQRCSRVAEE